MFVLNLVQLFLGSGPRKAQGHQGLQRFGAPCIVLAGQRHGIHAGFGQHLILAELVL